ncbi:MAG TPA: phosphotriesterase-related protein [Rhodothermales bacterium]|nr:phosphotriesterase-related protein [Rhodothermales bacterium]
MENTMTVVRTVRGDIPAGELGVCYGHEHLLGSPPVHLAEPDFILNSESAAVRELGSFRKAGGRALVEMSTPDYHRDAGGLRRIAERTGVHIVCATGFNKDTFSAPLVEPQSVDDLADRFVRDVTTGIDGTGVRAGVIKASSTLNEISPNAEKVFRAAAQAHLRTGAPISTHTEAGTMGLEQVQLLQSEGVDPGNVVIGHVDRKLEWSYHLDLAQTGACLSFDQIGKEKYCPDRDRATFILRLIEHGHGQQILLAGDMARRSYWPSYGADSGPGLTYILHRFMPWMIEEGLSEDAAVDLLVHNPARAFSMKTPAS